jgi:hypothetical protein
MEKGILLSVREKSSVFFPQKSESALWALAVIGGRPDPCVARSAASMGATGGEAEAQRGELSGRRILQGLSCTILTRSMVQVGHASVHCRRYEEERKRRRRIGRAGVVLVRELCSAMLCAHGRRRRHGRMYFTEAPQRVFSRNAIAKTHRRKNHCRASRK